MIHFSLECVTLQCDIKNKQDLLAHMVKQLAGQYQDIEFEDALAAVVDREQKLSTGVGHGVAIPHGRLEKLDAPYVSIAVLPEGIDYGSVDNQPVYIVVLMLSPSQQYQAHIQALASISKTLSAKDNRESFLQAANAAEVLALFN